MDGPPRPGLHARCAPPRPPARAASLCVTPPRREEGVPRCARGRIVAAKDVARRPPDLKYQPFPQRRRRVQQEEVHVPTSTHGLQDVEVAGRKPGQPEQRQPGRQVQELGLLLQPSTGIDEALGGALLSQALPEEAPQLELPLRLVELGRPGRPALEHVGTVDGVAVEEVCDVPDAREAPRAFHGCRVPHVLSQWREPRFVEVLLDHLDERPHGTLGDPGVTLRIGTCRARQRSADQRPREREGDVGAHAVLPALACTQVRGQALGQPPLDAACRH